jgi:hypothetical protein
LKVLSQCATRFLHIVWSIAPGIRYRPQHTPKRRQAVSIIRREIRAGMKRDSVRRQKDGLWPADMAGERLHRLHVKRIEIRSLLAIDGDVTNNSFITAAVASFSNDSWARDVHQ